MPDLKFKNLKTYFSILNNSGKRHPLLLPRVNNPNFLDGDFKIIAPPGIVQIIEGDLGLTEFAMKPILDPILSSLDLMPDLAASVTKADAETKALERNNPQAIESSFLTGDDAISAAKAIFLEKYIPKDFGMKPIEKTLISSMYESYKPLVDFVKLFIEVLAIAEDIFCMYLGSSIKILGKEIGVPSRNPNFWEEDLNYAQTINYALKEFDEAADQMVNASEKSISDDHPLKKNVPAGGAKEGGSIDIPALYLGYFDEDGNTIDPPTWIKNSGKWFSKTASDINGNPITVGAPFEQLSPELNPGIKELRDRHQIQIDKLIRDKNKMLDEIDKRAKDLETKNLSAQSMKTEIQSLNEEKKESALLFQELSDTLEDILDGSNKTKNNYVNDDKPADGINMPLVLNEWAGKVRGSQLRLKYYPELVSTVQALIDSSGEAKDPYIFIPKKNIFYNGKNFKVDVPLAFPAQITEKKVKSYNTFYDKKLSKDGKTYSFQNEIGSMDIYANTDRNKPYIEVPETHFGNEITNLFVPDNVKNYTMPMEWEEILEYEIRQKSTGKVLRTEKEVVPFSIDVENDYELRLIQVVNLPLIPPPNNSKSIDYYPNADDFLMFFKNSMKFLRVDYSKKNQDIELYYAGGQKVVINTVAGTSYFGIDRYIDETVFKTGINIYLRKSNSKFGDDSKDDKDDGNIFEIKNIKEIKKNASFNLKGLKDKDPQSLIIDNSKKTITDNHNYFKNIPTYITNYKKNNFRFTSGTTKNNYKNVKITSINKSNNKVVMKYTGNLTTETITAKYDTENSKKVVKKIKYDWADRTIVNTKEKFFSDPDFEADLFMIKDLNFIPDELKNPPKSFFGLGFDNNESIYSSVNKKSTRDNISKLLNTVADQEKDGLITTTGFVFEELSNGKKVQSMKIDIDIPDGFQYTTLSSDPNSKFYYPLRFVGYTTNPSGGDSKFIQDQLTETGTIYTEKNTIPKNYDPQKPNQIHSTPDIKEINNLKEGVIFHGLDPRYVARDKYKHFWLVEAIKKEGDGLAKVNGKENPGDSKFKQDATQTADKGKEWYGLIDHYLAPVRIITKLVPLIVAKLIPLAVKILQLVSNPTKIKDLLLDIALTNENISKLPQNFSAFSQQGTFGKIKDLEKEGVTDDFDDYDGAKSDPFVYTGPQVGVENPSIKTLMDGQALADFGLGAFGKAIISFGVDIQGSDVEVISSLVDITDFKKPPVKQTQVVVNFILQILKLPFETLFLIFKWIVDWVKKLLNPIKIPGAVKEFLTFEWLKNILGKDGLLSILGITCPKEDKSLQEGITEIRTGTDGENARFLLDQTKEALRGQNFEFIEVLVYNILVNGAVVATEREQRPYDGAVPSGDPDLPLNLADVVDSGNGFVSNDDIAANANKRTEDGENENLGFCGPRFFNIKDYVPIPFLAPMPSYNACELPIVYLKPLELLTGLFKFIQNIINGFLTIPSAILGLDPILPLPKFGEEIPFADVLEKILDKLRESTNQLVQK